MASRTQSVLILQLEQMASRIAFIITSPRIALGQINETQKKDSNKHVFDIIIRNFVHDAVAKFMIRRGGYLPEEETMTPAHPLQIHLVVRYMPLPERQCRRREIHKRLFYTHN